MFNKRTYYYYYYYFRGNHSFHYLMNIDNICQYFTGKYLSNYRST